MPAQTGLDALLRPEDSILVLIDHQPYQFANLNSHEPTMIVNNVIGLAKTAKVFNVPTILTTVIEERGGYIIKGLQDVFPDQKPIDRTFINTWQDPKVVDIVKKSGRKQLVLAALYTEICLAMPAIQALAAVEVSDRALAEAAGTLFEAQSFELMPSPGVQDARLSALLQALHAEQVSGYGSGRLFVDGIEQALAACLVSRYSTRRPKRRVPTGGLSPSRAKRLVDHIQAHIGSPLPLDELAACAGLSSSYLSRAFRETFSVT